MLIWEHYEYKYMRWKTNGRTKTNRDKWISSFLCKKFYNMNTAIDQCWYLEGIFFNIICVDLISNCFLSGIFMDLYSPPGSFIKIYPMFYWFFFTEIMKFRKYFRISNFKMTFCQFCPHLIEMLRDNWKEVFKEF